MNESEPLLDRQRIEEAFRRLGTRLARRGVVADLYVFGGAAMALAYDSRRATRDIDAVFKPHGVVLEEARAVDSRQSLGLSREDEGRRRWRPAGPTGASGLRWSTWGCRLLSSVRRMSDGSTVVRSVG
jgi:hypothetical protein